MNPPAVKLMPDYSADTPLWGDWEELALPTQLLTRLERWQNDFDRWFHYEHGWDTAQHRDRWGRDAETLINDLRQIIGNRAELVVDLWPLRPECEVPDVLGNLVGPDVIEQVRVTADSYCGSINANDGFLSLHEMADYPARVNSPDAKALSSLACTTDSHCIWLEIPLRASYGASGDRTNPATKAAVGFLKVELVRIGERRVEIQVLTSVKARWVIDDEQRVNRLSAFVIDVDTVKRRLLALLLDGVAPNDAVAFAVLNEDLARKRPIWNPDKAAYLRVAQGLVDPQGAPSHLNAMHPGLAAYVRDALTSFARARLS